MSQRLTLSAAVVLLALMVVACGGGFADSPPALPRDQFRSLVEGKTQREVISAVGRPHSTAESSMISWFYDDRTFDPITGKTDRSTQVVFDPKTGRVVAVNF